MLVSSGRRWAQAHELDNEPEATLAELLRLVSPCNLVGVGGFKRRAIPKIQVFRNANGQPSIEAIR